MIQCKLTALLQKEDMSQRQFAEQTGLNTKFLSRLGRNRDGYQMKQISFENIERLCRGLNVGIEDLFVID